jgi:uncharacterized protein YndB with AHSA1/START domain
MSEFRIVQDYPHPMAKVWRALTDPTLIPLWTSTGKDVLDHPEHTPRLA